MYALDMNDYLIKNHNNNKFISEVNQEHNFNIDCDTEEQKHMLITKKEIEVILLRRTSNLSLISIELKTWF